MSLKINLAAYTLISPKPFVGEAVCFPGGSGREFVADQSCTGVDVLFGVNGAPVCRVFLSVAGRCLCFFF